MDSGAPNKLPDIKEYRSMDVQPRYENGGAAFSNHISAGNLHEHPHQQLQPNSNSRGELSQLVNNKYTGAARILEQGRLESQRLVMERVGKPSNSRASEQRPPSYVPPSSNGDFAHRHQYPPIQRPESYDQAARQRYEHRLQQ